MTKTYTQITRQIEALTAQAEKLKRKEVDGVIARIKSAISIYGLTAEDLGLTGKKAAKKTRGTRRTASAKRGKGKKGAPAVKFRNELGQVWSGRGPRPHWLRDALQSGKELKDFAV